MLVTTRAERDDGASYDVAWRVVDELGDPSIIIDPRQRSRAWVEDRRAIDSFFLQEVTATRSPCTGAREPTLDRTAAAGARGLASLERLTD